MPKYEPCRTEQRMWIGMRIRALRQKERLTQYALGRLAGLNDSAAQSAINHWGTAYCVPRITVLPALCRALHITPNKFFEGYPP